MILPIADSVSRELTREVAPSGLPSSRFVMWGCPQALMAIAGSSGHAEKGPKRSESVDEDLIRSVEPKYEREYCVPVRSLIKMGGERGRRTLKQ